MMFLDCPAWLDQEGALRCGLPAEVRFRFTVRSSDGPVEVAMIRCPSGHWFNGPIEFLSLDRQQEHDAGTAAAPSRAAGRFRDRLDGPGPRRLKASSQHATISASPPDLAGHPDMATSTTSRTGESVVTGHAAHNRRECCRALRAARRPQATWPERDAETIPDHQACAAEQELLAAERHAALRGALADLTPRERQLIAVLTADPPVPYSEISARLGIPVGSIGPTHGRCLDKIRRHPAIAALINADTEAKAA